MQASILQLEPYSLWNAMLNIQHRVSVFKVHAWKNVCTYLVVFRLVTFTYIIMLINPI